MILFLYEQKAQGQLEPISHPLTSISVLQPKLFFVSLDFPEVRCRFCRALPAQAKVTKEPWLFSFKQLCCVFFFFFARIPNKTMGRNAVALTWSVPFQLSASPGTSQIHQLLNRKTVAMSRLLQVEISLKGNRTSFLQCPSPRDRSHQKISKKYMEK